MRRGEARAQKDQQQKQKPSSRRAFLCDSWVNVLMVKGEKRLF
jgi:hypothetical protein